MTHNNSIKEGTTASAKKLFKKAQKQKSDENEIQVLERFDNHPQLPDVHENKQVWWWWVDSLTIHYLWAYNGDYDGVFILIQL